MKHINIITISCLIIAGTLIGTSCHRQEKKEQITTPAQCDSIDYLIEGTASKGADSVYFKVRPYAKDENDRITYQTYPVSNGHFSFTVRQPLNKFIQIEDGNDGWMQLIIDNNARIKVDLQTNTVTEGSKLNRRFNHYQLIDDSIAKLMEQHQDDEDRTIYDSLNRCMDENWWQCITENLDNIIPAYCLSPSFMGLVGVLTPEQLAKCMKDEYAFTHHPEMKKAWVFFEAMQKRLPGQKYHNLELADTKGKIHSLSEYVGKCNYVLLDFWASWCMPCIASMPMMKELNEKYADHGLQIIGISLDDNHDKWVKAIKRNDLPWAQLSDLKGWESAAADAYGVRAIPEIVLISPEGEIIATGLDGDKLKAKLEEILSTNK